MNTNIQSESENNTQYASTSSEQNRLYTITEEILQQRMRSQSKGRYITQFYIAMAASFAALSFGITLGWSSPITEFLAGSKDDAQEKQSWNLYLMTIGCSAGTAPWIYGVNKLGPKNVTILVTPFYIFVFVFYIFFKTLKYYAICQFFAGFFSVAYLIGSKRLLMDTVHKKNLVHMIVFYRISLYLGFVISYVIGFLFSCFWLTIICIAIRIINACFLYFLPESPVFLYELSGRKAELSLQWYRGHSNIATELHAIHKDSELYKNRGSTIYMLCTKVVVKGILITLGLNFFRVFSGFYAFIFLNCFIWKTPTQNVCFQESIIFGNCLIAVSFVMSIFRYKVNFGMRKLLLISCTLVATTLSALTIYLVTQTNHETNISKSLDFVPFTALVLYVVFYEIGLDSYPNIILFEYLPFQVHSEAEMIVQCIYWFQNYILIRYFIIIQQKTSLYLPIAIITAISYISIFYCYYFIIEYKNKSLILIQTEIGGNPIGNRSAYRNRFEISDRQKLPFII